MKIFFLLILLLSSINFHLHAQIDHNYIDFWDNHQNGNWETHINRTVYKDGKLLYARLTPRDTAHYYEMEFFRLSDSLYYFLEFYKNNRIKRDGYFKVLDTIFSTDSIQINRPYPPYDWYDIVEKYYSVTKTGVWKEYMNENYVDMMEQYSIGKYDNGQKVGVWKYYESHWEQSENYSIDFDNGEKKEFAENVIYKISETELRAKLEGRWHLRNCDGNGMNKMRLFHDQTFFDNYNDDCFRYYEFRGNNFMKSSHTECSGHSPVSNGNWLLYKKKDDFYLEIDLKININGS